MNGLKWISLSLSIFTSSKLSLVLALVRFYGSSFFFDEQFYLWRILSLSFSLQTVDRPLNLEYNTGISNFQHTKTVDVCELTRELHAVDALTHE